VKKLVLRRHKLTRFRKDRSNRCGYIAILWDSSWRSLPAISDFQKFETWTVGPLKLANMRHRAKCQDRSNGCRDMAILRFFFKMAAVHHLGFDGLTLGPSTMTALSVISVGAYITYWCPVEFRGQNFSPESVPGLWCGCVCMILCLVEHRLVTDRRPLIA